MRVMRARSGQLDVDRGHNAVRTLRQRRGCDEEQLEHRRQTRGDARGAGESEWAMLEGGAHSTRQ